MNVVRITPSVAYPPKTGSERRPHGIVSRSPSKGGFVIRLCRRSRGLPSLGRYAHEVELAEGHVEALADLRTPDGDPGFEFVGSSEVVPDGSLTGEARDVVPLAMALFGCDVSERTTRVDPLGRLALRSRDGNTRGSTSAMAAKRAPKTRPEWRSCCTTSAMCRPPRGSQRTVWRPAVRVRCQERTVRTVYPRGVAWHNREMEGAH